MYYLEYYVCSIDRHGNELESIAFARIAEAREYFHERCEEISLPLVLANMDEEEPVGFVLEKYTANTRSTLMWYGDASLMSGWAGPADAFFDPLKQLVKASKQGVKTKKAKA